MLSLKFLIFGYNKGMIIPSNGLYFFIGPQHNEVKKLFEVLKQNKNYCFTTDLHDEIDQSIRQLGKGCLIFSDPKYALDYLKNNRWPDLKIKFLLLNEKNGSFKPETMAIFSQFSLEVYFPNTLSQMLTSLLSFNSGNTDIEEEIEFIVTNKIK
ncbi:MAG: hypothetical protein AB7I27_15790 [Bacteriovoracaceae bacterium]